MFNLKNLTLLLLFLSCQVHAQVASEVLRRYPAHIVFKVQSATKKVNISAAQQVKIADYFVSQDSIAEKTRKNGGTSQAISDCYKMDLKKIADVLSPIQYITYTTDEFVASTSEIAKAIKFREQIKLSAQQIQNLLTAYNAESANTNASSYRQAKRAEYLALKGIFTQEQYIHFFGILASQRISASVRSDFMLLKDSSWVARKDSLKVAGELKSYYAVYFPFMDYVTKNYPDRLAIVRDSLQSLRNNSVLKADALRDILNPSVLGKAYQYRNSLLLTDLQTTSLIDSIVSLKARLNRTGLNSSNTFGHDKELSKNILKKILTNQQYNKFWTISHRNYLSKYVLNSWARLKKEGLCLTADSAKNCTAMYNFILGQMLARDTMSGGYKKQVADSLKRISTINRPFVLWQLDAAKNALPASPLSKIIKQRVLLKLEPSQIDTLLQCLVGLEKARLSVRIKYGDIYVDNNSIITHTILNTLTNEQYNRYLTLKNYDRSRYNADQDWEKLKKAGLVDSKTEKAKVLKENGDYELRYLIAAESYKDNRTEKNLLAKHTIEYHKPDLLKKLDTINNESANNKRTKESFAW